MQSRKNHEIIVCENIDEYWKHIITCPGAGATINRNEYLKSLKLEQKQSDVQYDIWASIDNGVAPFIPHTPRIERYPSSHSTLPKDTPTKIDSSQRRLCRTLKIGGGNFLKVRISQKWGKLIRPNIQQDMREAF
jgi:hypothetical protein